MAEVFK